MPVQPYPQPSARWSLVRLSNQAEPHATSDVLFLATDFTCSRLNRLPCIALNKYILTCCKALSVFILQSTKGASAGDQGEILLCYIHQTILARPLKYIHWPLLKTKQQNEMSYSAWHQADLLSIFWMKRKVIAWHFPWAGLLWKISANEIVSSKLPLSFQLETRIFLSSESLLPFLQLCILTAQSYPVMDQHIHVFIFNR